MTPITTSSAPERVTRLAAMLLAPAGNGSWCERQGTQGPRSHRDRSYLIFAA
jgi:hypothetical protein